MNHIYIIEDDSVLCSELALALEAVGYHTTCANDFNNVLNEFLLVSPDLVILDINLPNTDGFILCMKIRKVSQVPIIFITGRDSQIDELQALSLGGDDYITKPYSLPVLMARIKNTLKRTYRSETSSEIEYNGLKLDLSNCTVMYNNVCVELSKRETQILCYLLNHAGHYVSLSKNTPPKAFATAKAFGIIEENHLGRPPHGKARRRRPPQSNGY